MDQIPNNSSTNSNNDSPPSSARHRQLQLHHHLQQQRAILQQQQQQQYNSIPQAALSQSHSSSSYSPHINLPPIPLNSQYFPNDLQSPTQSSSSISASVTGAVANNWPSHHRTSNSQDELHLSQQQYDEQEQYHLQQHQEQQHKQQQQRQFKREREDAMGYKDDKTNIGPSSSSSNALQHPARASDDPMPSTSDFVKKLYKMLEDPSFQSVVCWGPLGDCFVVKDMNEFTKSILPRMFKHSNFASFVRQLNKYDFHKVKNTDDNQFGEHSWTFRHPDFHADRRDALENIKRKVPAQRKAAANVASTGPLPSNGNVSYNSSQYTVPGNAGSRPRSPSPSHNQLKAEIQRLKDEGDDLRGRIRALERNYESVLVEMVGFQRGMAQQDGLMQSLIAYFLGSESGKLKTSTPNQHAQGDPSSSNQSGAKDPNSVARQLLKQQIQAHLQQQQHSQASSLVPSHLASSRLSLSQSQFQSQSYPTNLESHSPDLADHQNPFLPPQAVQRILGSSGSGYGNLGDVGRATLVQMNELSRRAAAGGFSAPSGSADETGRLWNEINHDGAGPSNASQAQQSQRRDSMGNEIGQQQKISHREEALNRIRDLHRERQADSSSGGWLGPSNITLARGSDAVRGNYPELRHNREEQRQQNLTRENVSNLSMDDTLDPNRDRRDDQSNGNIRQRQRRNSSAAIGSSTSIEMDTDESAPSSPDEYVMPSPPQPNTQSPRVLSSIEQQQQRLPIERPNSSLAWTKMMNVNIPFKIGSTSTFGPSPPSSSNLDAVDFENPDPATLSHEGLQVYTVGHLLPRNSYPEDAQGNWSFDTSSLAMGGLLGGLGIGGVDRPSTPQSSLDSSMAPQLGYPTADNADEEEEVVQPTPPNTVLAPSASSSSTLTASSGPSTSGSSKKLRVRRSTFVPGWAVPPRVLLVDDDAVSRRLSSKFLQVFGCTIDVAVDGIGAVNKMNLEKYDLVLMDIVMPKLDGVSATNLIRKFDQGTPIISMTSNSKPNEIMTYYSSGMNDILPKPFTKEGLLDMLEKHLMHLKVIQQLSRVPRSVGVPPLSDANFEQALTTQANTLMLQQGMSSSSLMMPTSSNNTDGTMATQPQFNFQFMTDNDDNGRINPLAGMGLSDEQYSAILQNLVNGDGFLGMMDSVNGSSGANSSSVPISRTDGPFTGEKRALDNAEDDERDGKRGRFEVIE